MPSTWTLPVIDLEALIHLWNFALQGHYLEFLSSALLCSANFHLPMAAPPWPALTCCLSQAEHRAPGLCFPDTAPSPHGPAFPAAQALRGAGHEDGAVDAATEQRNRTTGSHSLRATLPSLRPAVWNKTQLPFTESPSQEQRKLPSQAPPLVIMTIAAI